MTRLLIDTTYLCHRAFHSTGGLSHNGDPTGVAFGVLRDLRNLIEQFDPDVTVLAFDSIHSKRSQLDPNYKAHRKNENQTKEEIEQRKSLFAEMLRLQDELLPAIGFNNVFSVKGYEGDDIVAYFAQKTKPPKEAVIVSADNDLWQCLKPNVIWHNPKGVTVTEGSFRSEWGINPSAWATVKAIAGCSSDNVIGIKGVGDKTAAKFLSKELNPDTKTYQNIIDQIDEMRTKNTRLVQLPFPGLKLDLEEDNVSEDKFRKVEQELGIRANRGGRGSQRKKKRTPSQ